MPRAFSFQESGSGTDGTFGYEIVRGRKSRRRPGAVLSLAAVPIRNSRFPWPGSLSNYQLQSTDSLTAPNWTVRDQRAGTGKWPEYGDFEKTDSGTEILPAPTGSMSFGWGN